MTTSTASVFAPILAPAGTPNSLARELGVSSITVAKAIIRSTRGCYSSGVMFTPLSSIQLGTLRLATARVVREEEAAAAARAAWRAANPEAAAAQDAEDDARYAEYSAEYGAAA